MNSKRIISLLCVLALFFTLVSPIGVMASGNSLRITVGNATVVQGGNGDTTDVSIPIEFEGNVIITGFQAEISFNNLTLTKFFPGDVLEFTAPKVPAENTASLVFLDYKLEFKEASTGTLATLQFTLPTDEIKDFSIDLDLEEVTDNNFEDISSSITVVSGKISVTEKPKETITGLSFADKTFTYDGTAKTLAVAGTIPEGATVEYTSADFDEDGKAINAGTYNIKATVKKDGFEDWVEEATLTIEPKELTIEGLSAEDKVYDGTTVATLVGGTLEGVIGSDDVDATIPAEGTFESADASSNVSVNIADIELDGTAKDNYTLTQPTGIMADITKAPITVTAKDVTIKIGDDIPVFDEDSYEITAGELFGDDELTGTLTTDCKSASVVKTYSIKQGSLTAGDNYNLTFVAGKLYVIDKTLQDIKVEGTVTEKTYGDEGFEITVTPDENSNLDNFTMTSSNEDVATIDENGYVTIVGAGTTKITVAEAGNDDYAPFEKSWTLKVNKLNITVKAKDVTVRKGGDVPAFDENSYEITEGELLDGDTITGTLTTDCKSTSKVKTFNIKQGSLTAGNNYNLTFVAGKLYVVDRTAQNVTVEGIVTEKTYGDEGFEITVTPDENSNLDNFTMTSSNTDVATIDENGYVTIVGAGTTKITVAEAGNDDYAPFEKSWTLKVNKLNITVTADNISKKIGQEDPELTYTVTGMLEGDEPSGELTRKPGEKVGKYDILIGTLTFNNNYVVTYNKGVFEIFDKTPQVIAVAEIPAKTYGDAPFALEVTPDSTSNLDVFTYASSNADVAEVAADGTVTIKSVGETNITVTQAGNDEYAAAEQTVKLVVNPITATVTAIDIENKTATIEGILEADVAGVELDFDAVKTTVTSTEKSEGTITSTLKVTNFKFKGEKAKNYVADKNAYLTATVTSTTVEDNITTDENVTIEAAPAGDKTVIITDVAVAPETVVEKIAIDVTVMADTKVNTVAIPKATIDTIAGIGESTALEITLMDGSEENKKSTITLNSQALAAIQAAVDSESTVSVSVEKAETDELEDAQASKVEEVSTKAPVVYTLSIVDENGNSVAGSFGEGGLATVKLPYVKPEGRGTVVVKHLDDSGNLTNVANPSYDAEAQLVTIVLEHFSEYLIYTNASNNSGGGGGGAIGYTVKFETNGGSAVEAIKLAKEGTIEEPVAPTKDGFKFDGWYTDKELTTAYDFATTVSKSFTLYAKWTEIEESAETSFAFTDVKADDWFYENVKYVVENKLMNGVSEDEFAPNDTLTRAMLVTVLYRNAGEPATNRSIPFSDVDMGAYYANAVLWAKQNGIVNGVTENEFAPDDNITREQIAAIMFRYAQYKGMEAITLEENLHFEDANEISEYAVSAMNWAVGSGLMNGKSETTINPLDNATRAEIAAILQRFIEANK